MKPVRPEETYKLRSEFWDEEGGAKKCFVCSSEEVETVVHDRLDYTVCEYSHQCKSCGRTLAYWAHGGYDGPPPSDQDIQAARAIARRKKLKEEDNGRIPSKTLPI